MPLPNKHEYSAAWIENFLNKFINFVFYFRLIFVFLSLILLSFIASHVWSISSAEEKYKNLSIVFGLGSIAIGIFYSILNYENNHIKFKKEELKSRLIFSFNNVAEWHKPTMVENLKITKIMYDKHKHLISDGKGREFFELLESDEELRSALVSILNYFECIALAVKKEILDAEYIKESMGDVARLYVNLYGPYIKHRRTVHNSPEMWIHYTTWIEDWNKK